MPKNIAIKLTSRSERAVKKGHPWIFEEGIEKYNKAPETGDRAVIFDRKNNRFLGVGLIDMESVIRVRMFSTFDNKQLNQSFYEEALSEAKKLRAPILKTDTKAYRWVYGENDNMPGLIIDVYEKVLVLKLYATYWLSELPVLLEAIKVVHKDLEHIILRLNRNIQKLRQEQYFDGMVLLGNQEFDGEVIYKENGLSFSANVISGHKTGSFLDHRHNRLIIQNMAKGKKVLDVFTYSGGFSCYALAGGATRVTAVDISKKALLHAEKNAEINGFKEKLRSISGDAFKVLETLFQSGQLFDLIVIDPPSFAKRAEEVPSALSSYKRLLSLGFKLLSPKGTLLMASCSSRISQSEYQNLIEKYIKDHRIKAHIFKETTHGIDHPKGIMELDYLKSFYIKMI